MKTLAELYRLFPDKLGDLLLDECLRELRPVYIVDDWSDVDVPCFYCPRQSAYTFSHYDMDREAWFFPMPVPLHRSGTCDGEICIFLHKQFCEREIGAKRQRAFRKEYGCNSWEYPVARRHEACLASLLAFDAKVKGNHDRQHALAAG